MSTTAVITRTKNRPLLLARAMGSVLSQTRPDLAWVVVNDGGDPAILEATLQPARQALGDRLQIHHLPQSVGMEAASNVGIKASQSDYIIIHDDDDTWEPTFLQETMGYLDTHPDAQGVVTHTYRVIERMGSGDAPPTIEQKDPFNRWLVSVNLYRMCAQNTFPPISFLFRRAVLADIGLFREDLPVLGDWDFNLRFLLKHDIHMVKKLLANYHHRVDVRDPSATYGNSVVAGNELHLHYDCVIRNHYLRQDLATGKVGLGLLLSQSHATRQIFEQVRRTP
jgi:glycosyltransferase involved in cell wall biosynthesis